jgi:hypothetical protein
MDKPVGCVIIAEAIKLKYSKRLLKGEGSKIYMAICDEDLEEIDIKPAAAFNINDFVLKDLAMIPRGEYSSKEIMEEISKRCGRRKTITEIAEGDCFEIEEGWRVIKDGEEEIERTKKVIYMIINIDYIYDREELENIKREFVLSRPSPL